MYYDVCIKGGGPAGSLLAKLLAEKGWNTLLLEGSDFSRPRVGETLAAQVPTLLKSLGLEEEFATLATKPSYGIHSAWAEHDFSFRSHILNIAGNTQHVDRREFDTMLFDSAHSCGAEVHKKARVQSTEKQNSGWKIDWQDEFGKQTSKSCLFIDATGRKSVNKNQSLFTAKQFDKLVGIGITPLPFASPSKGLVLKTCEYGWWYLSPLTAETSVVLLMTDLDVAKENDLTNYSTWKRLLPNNEFFGGVKAQLKDKDALQVKPAQSQIVTDIHTDGFMAVGDALCSFDPVTGSGVLRALQTAQGLAKWLEENPSITPKSIIPFLDQVAGLYTQYLDQWQRVYSMVTLWPSSPFWNRRRTISLAA